MKIAYALARCISLIGYCFIFLSGWMIGVPFIIYLFVAFFEFGSMGQLAAMLSLTGLLLLIIPFKITGPTKKIALQFVIYSLLLAPIIERFVKFPLLLFNYPLFIVPTAIFVLLFPLSIILLHKIELTKRQ